MPEIDFYFTVEDETRLVEYLFGEGCYLVPSILYEEPVPLEITTTEEYFRIKDSARHDLMHAISPAFRESPLDLRPVDRPEGRRYYVAQRVGGPTLMFWSKAPFTKEEGYRFFPGGNAGYYRTYWSTRFQRNVLAPVALKELYAGVCKLIKKGATRITLQRHTYYCSPSAMEASRRGCKLGVLPLGLDVPPGTRALTLPRIES